MSTASRYLTIKIDINSDCWGEIDALKELLLQNTGYIPVGNAFSAKDVVSIAVNELYDKLAAEAKSGVNQRRRAR